MNINWDMEDEEVWDIDQEKAEAQQFYSIFAALQTLDKLTGILDGTEDAVRQTIKTQLLLFTLQ